MTRPSAAVGARELATPVALALLGAALLARWADAWQNHPDLVHAWTVPVLAAYLVWERRVDLPPTIRAASAPTETKGFSFSSGAPDRRLVLALIGPGAGLVVALYLGGRVLLAPFPAWPAALWIFSFAGWTLALGLIAAAEGRARARHFAFPILFTATALPWLTWMDVHLVLPLRAGLATIAAEVVHLLGYPTSVAGTVITVGRGQVGVDEACSGVRSLQAVIVIALFLGDLLRLVRARRLALLAIGLLLALASNLGRTCFLAWQAATRGPEAATLWHDRAGQLQLIVALGGLALVAWRWNRFAAAPPSPGPRPARTKPRRLIAFPVALGALVLATEVGVAWWFHPAPSARAADWSARLPHTDFSYRSEIFSPAVHEMLRYDSYQAGEWETPSGHRRAGYVLDWTRGEIARDIISLHSPEVCLPIGGQPMLSGGDRVSLPAVDDKRPALPFRTLAFAGERGPFFVFYLSWDLTHARPLDPGSGADRFTWLSHRFGEIAARRGRFAARVFALAIYDEPDQAAATVAFLREAPALLPPPRN